MMNVLESYRQERGLTYDQFAELTGLPKTCVWKHCRGMQAPDAESIAQYMKSLQLSFEELRPDLFLSASSHLTESQTMGKTA